MEEEPRRLRADAERNRRRLVAAATEMFAQRGLDVGVGEIAERAGVGRGTLFRHYPSKEALVVAVLIAGVRERIVQIRERLADADPVTALDALIEETIRPVRFDRALIASLDDEWFTHPEVREVHGEMLALSEELITAAQASGAVRADLTAIDLLLLVKGVCEAALAFPHLDAAILGRQLDLVRAAIAAPGAELAPLRDPAPTLEDLEPSLGPCASSVRSAVPVAAPAPARRAQRASAAT